MRNVVLGALALFAASPVLAADYLYSPEPDYYGYSSSGWSGQYIGGSLGGQNTRIDLPPATVLEGFGLVGGIFAGVNFEEGGLVFGAEADVEWNSYDQAAACTSPAWYCSWQGSLRARLGYAMDDFHIYGTAGLAAATVGSLGWTAGVGAEFAFSETWFARAEYRYTALGSANPWVDPSQTGVTAHAVRTGIGYRF